ncbi:hypothetical protein O181_088430 [Austropuccinia psidii MF-1]|uniref:Uncharacterized protein n=1 Tax=Austropuccinia psidii MF-1 TaxID=1389203 RepID=A0A9Q3IRH8_9BASI|nr:hypothetical protein [Austropuccinia psidii MF-1]
MSNIPLLAVYCNPSSTVSTEFYSDSNTPTFSLGYDFGKKSVPSQPTPIKLPQFKHLPPAAPRQESPNLSKLPNIYVPHSKDGPSQGSIYSSSIPKSPPRTRK